ncbi:MAG: hypothetical protein FJZ57_03600 [Chlamydiae bacterium]|nr:hypothetical protein [Chlamydiota bacterium]
MSSVSGTTSQMVITSQPIGMEDANNDAMQIEPVFSQNGNNRSFNMQKCAGTTIFGLSHFTSISIMGYALVNSSYVLGGLGVVNLCTGGIGHWMWSKFSDISGAADKVSEAVIQARKAAIQVELAAKKGRIVADKIGSAADKVEHGAEKIQKTVVEGRSDDMEKQAFLTREFAEEIKEQNEDMGLHLEEFKKTLGPLLGMMGTIRHQLQEIRSGFTAGIPKISQLENLETRFKESSVIVQNDIQSKADCIREILKDMTEEAVVSLQLVRDNNKILIQILEQKSSELTQALDSLSRVSTSAHSLDLERQELLAKLHKQEEENNLLQTKISDVILSLERERAKWEAFSEQNRSDFSDLARGISGETQHLTVFMKRLQGIMGTTQDGSEAHLSTEV